MWSCLITNWMRPYLMTAKLMQTSNMTRFHTHELENSTILILYCSLATSSVHYGHKYFRIAVFPNTKSPILLHVQHNINPISVWLSEIFLPIGTPVVCNSILTISMTAISLLKHARARAGTHTHTSDLCWYCTWSGEHDSAVCTQVYTLTTNQLGWHIQELTSMYIHI